MDVIRDRHWTRAYAIWLHSKDSVNFYNQDILNRLNFFLTSFWYHISLFSFTIALMYSLFTPFIDSVSTFKYSILVSLRIRSFKTLYCRGILSLHLLSVSLIRFLFIFHLIERLLCLLFFFHRKPFLIRSLLWSLIAHVTLIEVRSGTSLIESFIFCCSVSWINSWLFSIIYGFQ
jgi:hypothetical protein